jgi:D-glycero-alpha-D-manno-heptose 1-phosphate guanylyltransferase
MEAMILIGGKGTRMEKYTDNNPKCLINMHGKPFIYWLLRFLMKNKVNKFILCSDTNYKSIENLINIYNFNKDNFYFSIERKQLGTGGAILNALKLIKNNEFYLINGDIIFDISLLKLKKIHKNNSNDLTYSLLKLENRKTSYGGITINQSGVVKKHKNLTHNSKFSIIDSGFRIINKNAIIDYHQTNTNLVQSFEDDIAPWLIKNKKVKGVLFNSNFFDIGNPKSYFISKSNFQQIKSKLQI